MWIINSSHEFELIEFFCLLPSIQGLRVDGTAETLSTVCLHEMPKANEIVFVRYRHGMRPDWTVIGELRFDKG